jgi:heme-degrading monooxygenase HmoA
MLLRILTMHVDPARVGDWMRFTRDIGFPGMLAQPGCRQVWRLRGHAGADDYKVMTLWDGAADLERFRAGDAIRSLSRAAAHLVTAPASEELFDIVDDPAG